MQTFSVSGSSFFQRNRWRISSIFQVGKQSHSSINNHASSDQSQIEEDDDQKHNSKPENDIEMFRDFQSYIWPRRQSHFNGHQWVQQVVHTWTDSIWNRDIIFVLQFAMLSWQSEWGNVSLSMCLKMEQNVSCYNRFHISKRLTEFCCLIGMTKKRYFRLIKFLRFELPKTIW